MAKKKVEGIKKKKIVVSKSKKEIVTPFSTPKQENVEESKFFNKEEDLYSSILFARRNSKGSKIYSSVSCGRSVRHGPRGGHHHT